MSARRAVSRRAACDRAAAHTELPRSVGEALRTPGEALERDTREVMESRFRFDFGHIRIHRGRLEGTAARDVGADAFTAGRHIVFADGKYAPRTLLGRAILAHELAHSTPADPDPGELRLGGTHDSQEAQADDAALRAISPNAPRPQTSRDHAPVVRRTAAGAAIGGLAGLIGGAGIGSLIGLAFGPAGALIGAGIGAVVGGIAGAIIGHFATEPGAPMHMETSRDTDLETDPTAPTHMVLQRLPAGTRLAPADVTASAPTSPNHFHVRVTTGPFFGAVGWVRKADVVSVGLTDVLTLDQVADLYRELAGATFTRSGGGESPIPFHYPIDGCYARAERMADLLEEKGYASEKIFAVSRTPAGRSALRVATPYGVDRPGESEPAVGWWYHVAPIVRVRLPSGEIAQRVLDPSTQSGPVTYQDWIGTQSHEQFRQVSRSALRSISEDAGWGGSVFAITPRSAYTPELDVGEEQPALEPIATMTEYSGPEYAGAQELAATLRGHVASHAPLATVLAAIAAAAIGSRRALSTSSRFVRLRQQLESEYGAAGFAQITTALQSTTPSPTEAH